MKLSPRVTPAEIKATIEKIIADGGRVTADEIRARLGRGSLSTIYKGVRDWERSRQEELGGGAKLTGETTDYLISSALLQVPNGPKIASLVIRGVHILIDEEEIKRIIKGKRSQAYGKNERILEIMPANTLRLTVDPEFEQRLIADLKAALGRSA